MICSVVYSSARSGRFSKVVESSNSTGDRSALVPSWTITITFVLLVPLPVQDYQTNSPTLETCRHRDTSTRPAPAQVNTAHYYYYYYITYVNHYQPCCTPYSYQTLDNLILYMYTTGWRCHISTLTSIPSRLVTIISLGLNMYYALVVEIILCKLFELVMYLCRAWKDDSDDIYNLYSLYSSISFLTSILSS